MTAFTEKLDRAAGAATCAVLEVGGASLIGTGVVGLAAGGTGVVPLAAGAAAVMASSFLNCSGWDPDKPGPDPTGPPIDYCSEAESDTQIQAFSNGNPSGSSPFVRKITAFAFNRSEPQPNGSRFDYYDFAGVTSDGTTVTQELSLFESETVTGSFKQVFEGDPTCKVPETPGDQPIDIPPFEYTDPEDGCELTVNFYGFGSGSGGNASPVFKIEPNAATRAQSDVIGGCNFEPVIYMGDPNGGPPYVGPWDPDWDVPGGDPYKWKDKLKDIANICSNADVLKRLDELLVNPFPGDLYALNSVCELDAQGNPVTETVEEVIPSSSPLVAIALRINALVPLLQGQKDFKQPVCPPAKAAGDLRTISFRSEEVSPNGKSCLRKRLRYRSLSGIGLDGLIDHWKDFSFSAGPVIVKNIGSTCGSLTVWASSVDEGKRVILHAFAEAGVDANQAGRWEVSSSTSTRRGMPGTMNIDITGGYYWITARDGSSQRPIVGKT